MGFTASVQRFAAERRTRSLSRERSEHIVDLLETLRRPASLLNPMLNRRVTMADIARRPLTGPVFRNGFCGEALGVQLFLALIDWMLDLSRSAMVDGFVDSFSLSIRMRRCSRDRLMFRNGRDLQ